MASKQSIAPNIRSRAIATACLMFLGVSPVLAQTDSSTAQDQWQFSGAIYVWGAGMGGQTIGGSAVEFTFSDLLDNLELGGMGAFAARKNKWSVLSDIIYLGLGTNKTVELSVPVGPVQLPVTTRVNLDVDGWVLHAVAGYELYSDGGSRLDLIGGARFLDLSMDMFLELQSLGPGQSRTISESLTTFDGIVGLTGLASLGENWFLPYYVDVGAGDSKMTWQATAGVGYRAGSSWDLALVYRHLEWDFDSAGIVDDMNFSGPAFGVIFRW